MLNSNFTSFKEPSPWSLMALRRLFSESEVRQSRKAKIGFEGKEKVYEYTEIEKKFIARNMSEYLNLLKGDAVFEKRLQLTE